MLKTYLYVPEKLENKITFTAQLHKKSKAEIIRLALEKGLNSIQHQGTASAQLLFQLAKLGTKNRLKGPKNSSQKIDQLLWGKEWEKSV